MPLTFAMNSHSNKYSPRQVCFLNYIAISLSSHLTFDNVENIVAVVLPHIETNTIFSGQSPSLSFAVIAKTQVNHPQLQALQA